MYAERERTMLKREEVKQKLIDMGVAEPTDEQVSSYLAVISNELKASEDRATKFKAQADRVHDLEKQLEEANTKGMSEIELAQKQTEDAMREVDNLRKTVKQMEQLKALSDIGIVGDDATGLISEDGSLNTEKLGEIISAREKSAVATYQKQSLENTPAPDDKKPDEENKPYKDIVDRVAASKKAETEAVNIIDAYK